MKPKQSTRVAFILAPDSWLGGRNYLRNLFAAIRTLPDETITPIVFTGTKGNDPSTGFPGVQVIKTSTLDPKSPAWFARKIIAKTTSQDIIFSRLLRKHSVSILSHTFRYDGQTGVRTIGWIPDFQHVHLPEFFSEEDRHRRDREFRKLCIHCDKVIVSSECAGADLRAFSPKYADKIELLRFVASPIPVVNAASLQDLHQIYDFNQPYFLLPNQFWAHKNHRAVLDALKILTRTNHRCLVLATGSSKDERNPAFFSSFMEYAAKCGVLDHFRVLGQIPFDHLVGLMRHTIAFINPSRFEGWSTSVEEAKSMGKQIVLSDIPVHREQAPERAFYFRLDDSESLAQAMTAADRGFDVQKDEEMQERARARFPRQQQEFGEIYQAIVKKVV